MRVSDSGLGCGPGGSGFHGWPFCNGDVVPGLDLNSIVEYTHRALAGAVEHHDRSRSSCSPGAATAQYLRRRRSALLGC